MDPATPDPRSEPLLESEVDPDPLVQFGRWFDEAAAVVDAPEAMAVASVGDDGQPSVRMVLLKQWGPDGFVFHSNYSSRKGRELIGHPRAALLFYWEPRGRQIRIEGPIEPTTAEESDAYFATRPRGAQIGALASEQSAVVATRQELDDRVRALEARFEGQEVPRPPGWGGLRVHPVSFEFWQNRRDRLHDRLRYLPGPGGWRIDRLQP
jgi:pyridoxamine 5'-phosphate oxidase